MICVENVHVGHSSLSMSAFRSSRPNRSISSKSGSSLNVPVILETQLPPLLDCSPFRAFFSSSISLSSLARRSSTLAMSDPFAAEFLANTSSNAPLLYERTCQLRKIVFGTSRPTGACTDASTERALPPAAFNAPWQSASVHQYHCGPAGVATRLLCHVVVRDVAVVRARS